MTNIKDPQKISEAEARLSLQAIEAGIARGDFSDQDFSRLAVTQLRNLIQEYENNKSTANLENHNIASPVTVQSNLATEELQNSDLKDSPLKYPKDHLTKSAAFEELLKQKDSQSLSKMNFESIKRKEPFGKIAPACPGVLFIDQELAIPHPTGKVVDLGLADYYPSSKQLFSAAHEKPERIAIDVDFPKKAVMIPMPLAAGLHDLKNVIAKVSPPTESDPVVWRLNPWQNQGLSYSIAEDQNHKLLD